MDTVRAFKVVSGPLTRLLDDVLVGVVRDVPGACGVAVSVAHPAVDRGAGQLQVLSATGVGPVLPPITSGHLWGPSLLAAAGEEPIVTGDVKDKIIVGQPARRAAQSMWQELTPLHDKQRVQGS